jgi:hypothetical protein
MKDRIHLHRDKGSPNFWQKPSNWFFDTWSKAPLISINRHEDSNPLVFANWISCVSARAASIADFPLLPPICSGYSRLVVSAR